VARDFYEKCLIKKSRKRAEDILYNEQNTGTHFKALDYVRILFQLQKLNVVDLEKVKKNLTDVEFNSKFRALIIKNLFEMKKFFHSVSLIDITSATAVQKDTVTIPNTLKPLYTASAGEFAIAVAKGIIGPNDKRTVNMFEGKTEKVTVIDYARYAKFKNFVSLSVEKKSEPSYFLMIFEHKTKKFYFEMYSNGKNTLTIDPVNLSLRNIDKIKEHMKIGLNYDL